MKKETKTVRFLYRTVVGRGILKILVQPWVSKVAGVYLSSTCSRWLVRLYVKKHQIDLSLYPKKKYASFNDFFTRERSNQGIDITKDHLISPCDALLTVHTIGKDSVYQIKHIEYSLAQLLGDAQLAKYYEGGYCLTFRLTPQHYHRYAYICDGIREKEKKIPGKLHCVRPIAYTTLPVFLENSREYTVLASEQGGKIVQMEVGAMLVGKIRNHLTDTEVYQGMEKGYFEFGGSTIIVLLEKDRAKIHPQILKQSALDIETDVSLGMKIGEFINQK